MTSIEKIIQEIDKELNLLSNLFGTEIMGRKIGLNFAKRICEETKERHKEEIIQSFKAGLSVPFYSDHAWTPQGYTTKSEQYYQYTFQNNDK